jgi:uncharacterized protein YecT (DUF1311 family)
MSRGKQEVWTVALMQTEAWTACCRKTGEADMREHCNDSVLRSNDRRWPNHKFGARRKNAYRFSQRYVPPALFVDAVKNCMNGTYG